MCPLATTPSSPLFTGLVRSVTTAYNSHRQNEARAAATAEALQPFLGDPRLLNSAQQEADSERYRQHLLHVDPRGVFSIVALVWLPGQGTSIHDHVSWCVVGIHQGAEREEEFQLIETPTRSYLTPLSTSICGVGEVAALTPPGDIHRVDNPGPDKAISIHIYGADLRQAGTSIRRRYELPVVPRSRDRLATEAA